MVQKRTNKYLVRGSLRVRELSRAGASITLKLFERGERLGTLEIGQGSLRWYSRSAQKPKRMNWGRFARHMDTIFDKK